MKGHTPGPWKKSPNIQIISSQGVIINPEDGSEAIGFVLGGNSEECKANARLIAAAPDLLEALKGFIYSVEHEGVIHGRVVSAVENAQQAIAKATEGKNV